MEGEIYQHLQPQEMEEKEPDVPSQQLKKNEEVNAMNSEEITPQKIEEAITLKENEKESSANSEELIQEINGENKNEGNNASHDVSKEISCDEKEILIQNAASDIKKTKESLQENQVVSTVKKGKAVPKQNSKGKHTVPQPFSLATDKRMTREKKGGLEQSNSSPSKSVSLRTDAKSPLRTVQTQTSVKLERITEVRHGTTNSGSTLRSIRTQTSLRIERSSELRTGTSRSAPRSNEHAEKKMETVNQMKDKGPVNEVEAKKSRPGSKPKEEEGMEIDKLRKSSTCKASPSLRPYHKRSASLKPEPVDQEGEGMEINKLRKCSTFKAPPSPSPYHRRSGSLKPEPVEKEGTDINKLQKSSTFKASPLPSFYHKRAPPQKPELIKIPVTHPKSPVLGPRSKSVSESGSKKTEAMNKAASRTISASAKETIKKLLRGPWKAPSGKRKEPKKTSASCGEGLEKGVVASAEGNNVAVSG